MTASRLELCARCVAALAITLAISLLAAGRARADTNQQVLTDLSTHDVYISDLLYLHHAARPADLNRLQSAVFAASKRGVTEKIALVWRYPANIHSAAQGAAGIRNFLDLQGTLILVSPQGVGLSSLGDLSTTQSADIAHRALPRCETQGFVSCAVLASQLAAAQASANHSSDYRNALIFWAVALGIFGLIVAGAVLWTRRRPRPRRSVPLDDLRTAASATLQIAESTSAEVERSAAALPEDKRPVLEDALTLRNRAREELSQVPTTVDSLIQANQDAAEAVLVLHRLRRGLEPAESADPLASQPPRCLYCGRDDRPPYLSRPVEDGKGSSLTIEICAVCTALLQQGRTPPIATVRQENVILPWWTVQGNPWYSRYGGPAWQYWLPFLVGMDVGGWFEQATAPPDDALSQQPTPSGTSGQPAGA
jgi:hypothetical protein